MARPFGHDEDAVGQVDRLVDLMRDKEHRLAQFALYAQQWAWGTSYMNWFGWVFVWLSDAQNVRTWHHLAMWYVVLFAVAHIYMVFREDIMSGESVISTMVNGIRMFKRPVDEVTSAAAEPPPARAEQRRAA